MTLLENTIDKIDKLDLTFHLKCEIKTILFDHILKEIEKNNPETINHKP